MIVEGFQERGFLSLLEKLLEEASSQIRMMN
jgi:hypothetical protein